MFHDCNYILIKTWANKSIKIVEGCKWPEKDFHKFIDFSIEKGYIITIGNGVHWKEVKYGQDSGNR